MPFGRLRELEGERLIIAHKLAEEDLTYRSLRSLLPPIKTEDAKKTYHLDSLGGFYEILKLDAAESTAEPQSTPSTSAAGSTSEAAFGLNRTALLPGGIKQCPILCRDLKNYVNHKRCRGEEGDSTCCICRRAFETEIELRLHAQEFSHKKICCKCSDRSVKKFDDMEAFKKHIASCRYRIN